MQNRSTTRDDHGGLTARDTWLNPGVITASEWRKIQNQYQCSLKGINHIHVT